MKKFNVTMPYWYTVDVTVDEVDEDEAVNTALLTVDENSGNGPAPSAARTEMGLLLDGGFESTVEEVEVFEEVSNVDMHSM